MGGNGSRSSFIANTLDGYLGVRFNQVGTIDGVEVVAASTQSNDAIPMESFTSSMYYVTKPGEPKQITHVAFYDKNGNIKVSLDLEYDSQGNLKPFETYTKKSKTKTRGSHMHRWSIDDNGDKGRKSHDPNNIGEINKYYMRFVNKALKYNQ